VEGEHTKFVHAFAYHSMHLCVSLLSVLGKKSIELGHVDHLRNFLGFVYEKVIRFVGMAERYGQARGYL
jgi:hypothetical protein